MQPNLLDCRSEGKREENHLIQQLECAIERNRTIYQEAMDQFQTLQASTISSGSSNSSEDR